MSAHVMREFAYLDRQILEDLLSSIEDGIAEQIKNCIKDHRGKPKVKGSIKIIECETGEKYQEIDSEELKKTTDASLFQRLFDHLERSKNIKKLSLRSKSDNALDVGQFFEIEGNIELSNLEKLIDNINSLTQFMKAIGQKFDARTKEAVKGFQILGSQNVSKRLSVKVSIPENKTKFIAILSNEKLRIAKNEIEGKYKIFCRVSKVLQKNETLDLFSLFPAGIKPNRSQLKDFLRNFKDTSPLLNEPITEEDLRIKYPAAPITAIAIYR
jgi:hypothetical protein